jgi:hypothetical protein
MFCPKCGKGEQTPETYCRQCGGFLPDLSRRFKREIPPEEHLKVNLVLSSMTIVASFTLAFLLYSILGFRPETHPLIYVAGSFFFAIGGWQIQTVIRTWKLRQQWRRRAPAAIDPGTEQRTPAEFDARTTARQLDPADLRDSAPASVTENTTRQLENVPRAR